MTAPTERDADVWLLFGRRKGDNDQLLALGEQLGRPFRIVQLDYTPLSLLPPALVGAREWAVKRSARHLLTGPEPSLILAITSRSVSPALAIRKRFGGRPKLVQLGHPRADPRLFDLVITTPQYAVPDVARVLRLPLPVTRPAPTEPDDREQSWLDRMPRPHHLLVVGGHSMWWHLRPERITAALRHLLARAEADGGSVIVVGSPRSPAPVMQALAKAANSEDRAAIAHGSPRYRVLLADADEIFVTADSASMIAEAVATGKPVGVVPIGHSIPGRFAYAMCRAFGINVPMRDLTKLWDRVKTDRLAGTLAQPVAAARGGLPLDRATAAIEQLMGWSSPA